MSDDHIGRNGELFPTGTISTRMIQAAQEAAQRIKTKNEQQTSERRTRDQPPRRI